MRTVVVAVAVLLAGCTGGPAVSNLPVVTDAPSLAPVTPTPTGAPSPSPIPILDGEPWIVYEWWLPDHDEQDIFLVRPDGSDAHAIAEDLPGEHRGPVWSPDGAQLAFVIRGDDTPAPNGGIWLSDADGTNAKPLFDAPRMCSDGAFWPAWSPDGSRLSFTCYRDGKAHLQVIDVATLQVTEIAAVGSPETFDNPATWSPDGKQLAFDILHYDPTDSFVDGSLLAVAPSAGGATVRRITEFSSFAAYPAWHPTRDLIAFNTYDEGAIKLVPEPAGLFTIAPDGSGRRQLALPADTSVRLARPRWYPDGSGLLANLGHGNPVEWSEIVVVSVATGTWSSLAEETIGAAGKLRPVS